MSFTEVNSAMSVSNEYMTSEYITRSKLLQNLSELYDSCRGQVTHRSHDLDQLKQRLESSRGRLSQITNALEQLELALDLDAKTTQYDRLRVSHTITTH